jgi:DNA-directed RNA polymerase specialized sigma24 family protein
MKTLRQNRRWSANLAYAQIEATTDPTQEAEEYDWLTQGLARLSPDHCASRMLIYHQGHSAREVSDMTRVPWGRSRQSSGTRVIACAIIWEN